jgi:two-component system sensor histidine kinase KdpD
MYNPFNILQPKEHPVKTAVIQYLISLLSIGITILLCIPLAKTESYHLVSFILLIVVSFLATFLGTGPVLIASTVSAMAWDFFFISPHGTFHIERTDDLLIFGLFFFIAIINGVLTTRVRRQERLVRERENRTNTLLQLTTRLAGARNLEGIITIGVKEIKTQFGGNVIFLLRDENGNLTTPTNYNFNLAEYAPIAQWSLAHMKKSGYGTPIYHDCPYTFCPLSGSKHNPGVLVVIHPVNLSTDQHLLWDAFLSQISSALEREFLGELAQRARFLHESDRLYKTLFNSISHEFRIPVATIMGASDTLLNEPHPETIQTELHNEIFKASVRLNRLVENLLNMSRLESGFIAIRLDWHDINDLINKVADDLENELAHFKIQLTIQDDMPLVRIDYGLMEQTFYNLIINATQHTPAGATIKIGIEHHNDLLEIRIADEGMGFPEEDLPNVFSKFYKLKGNKSKGLGLGLSIVKGFVDAHNGTIEVKNNTHKGVTFTLKIPSPHPDITHLQTDKI